MPLALSQCTAMHQEISNNFWFGWIRFSVAMMSPPITWRAAFPCWSSPQTSGAIVHCSVEITELKKLKLQLKNLVTLWFFPPLRPQAFLASLCSDEEIRYCRSCNNFWLECWTCSRINCGRSVPWVMGDLSEEPVLPCDQELLKILVALQHKQSFCLLTQGQPRTSPQPLCHYQVLGKIRFSFKTSSSAKILIAVDWIGTMVSS